ncbi:MAG: hypothetical protein EB127_30285 [Alphaproteobacteria bacterium]|nr:hypothetical protein [Alphaproteobacteria bacterium]
MATYNNQHVNMFNIPKQEKYTTMFDGTYVGKEVLHESDATILMTPVGGLVYSFFVIAYDNSYVGSFLKYSLEVRTLADFLNGWNATMINMVNNDNYNNTSGNAYLFMSLDWLNPSQIFMTNPSNVATHLFAGPHKYLGEWQPFETKILEVGTFVHVSSSSICNAVSSLGSKPIIVTCATPVLRMTAYIYRKKNAGYYIKEDVLVVPPGFYPSLDSFIACLNYNITMRGERNGYIFHFINGARNKNPSSIDQLVGNSIGVEAAHRQPDPSHVIFEPLHTCLGLFDTVSLLLRTSKREYFPFEVANVI